EQEPTRLPPRLLRLYAKLVAGALAEPYGEWELGAHVADGDQYVGLACACRPLGQLVGLGAIATHGVSQVGDPLEHVVPLLANLQRELAVPRAAQRERAHHVRLRRWLVERAVDSRRRQ